MITIKINDKVYTDIPSSFDEMSIGRYQDYLMTVYNTQKEKKYPSEYGVFLLIATLIGCDMNDIMNMMPSDVELLINTFSYIQDTSNIKDNGSNIFEIDNIKYGMRKNFNGMNTGEMLMCENILKGQEVNYDKFHILLAILIRRCSITVDEFGEEVLKIKEVGSTDEVMKRAKLFQEKMSVNDSWYILENFFYTGTDLPNASQSSSSLQITKQ